MGMIRSVLAWGKRLPLRFSVVFVVLLCSSILVVGGIVHAAGPKRVADLIWAALGLPRQAALDVFWEGIVIVAILAAVVLISYNASARISRLLPYSSINVPGVRPIPPDPCAGWRRSSGPEPP